MAKHEAKFEAVIDDMVWYDGDYALDHNNELFQLHFNDDGEQYWFAMGSELELFLGKLDGPVVPVRKVVLFELPISSKD